MVCHPEKFALQRIDKSDVSNLLEAFTQMALQFDINFRLFKMREHGLQARVQSQIYTKRPLCHSHGQNFESVRIIDCYAALLILAYGFAASILLLIGEFILNKGLPQSRCCS